MNVWVKICGITDAAALAAAVETGADAVGFVFAPSPRQISVGAAKSLKRRLPGNVASVAVMRHPLPQVARPILDELQPDYLQTDVEDLPGLTIPDACGVLPVLRESSTAFNRRVPERFVYEGHDSGVGEMVDWERAYDYARSGSMILAGGLTPLNVGDAIRLVEPWGVDVSSGVESGPGVKDPQLIEHFLRAVRETEASIHDLD